VPLPVTVLEERSEIVWRDRRFYFTQRRPLEARPYEGDAECGVCGEPAGGCVAITCSGCGAVSHEGALREGGERACFSHRSGCPGCGLDRPDFAWSPEGEERCSI
jgi:hypothetical protein